MAMVDPSRPTPPEAPWQGRTVVSLIMGHLASSPRVQKQARALREAGARVLVRGNWLDPRLAQEDLSLARELDIDFAAVTDLRPGRRDLGDRLRHRLAHEGFKRIGLFSSRILGPGAPELWRYAAGQPSDLVTVHSEPGLWVAKRLLGAGKRIVVDFEDWFSEDQLPSDRSPAVRGRLRQLEMLLLHRAHGCLAPTEAMASALAESAGTDRRPTVVRNCFPAAPVEDRPSSRVPGPVSFYWFSQTIGPGRGLEVLASALPQLRGEWNLYLRGAMRGYGSWFDTVFGGATRSRVHVLPPVPNDALLAANRQHAVGLALEAPYCRNKELTASNKIHEYMRAGAAVIATRTAGQVEVMAASPGAGLLVEPGDATGLAAAMQALIDSPEKLAACRQSALTASREVWDWSMHAPRLLDALERAMGK
ncbi:glycosyltransferase [Luteimonas vadosa]|uniref:Glycosyltransferase subfamily 4-like N-terminal domain-containing protein n=1 Tax=Luteimonas vadosa TaxID=1165507 RepID=A0ABP9DPH2_9GAMM